MSADIEKFMQDLARLYEEVQRRERELNLYYRIAKGESHPEASRMVDDFLRRLSIQRSDESLMAALERVVSLKEEALEKLLRKSGADDEEIVEKKELAYSFVSAFHMGRFEELITWIVENELFTPFYRELIQGVHLVGMAMSRWHLSWNEHIINGTNRELFELFNGDEEKIYEMLREKDLLERDAEALAQRSYSVLLPGRDGYRKVPYAEAFREEVEEVAEYLGLLIEGLRAMDDELFGRKNEWISYFINLRKAIRHTGADELVEYWRNVDRAWMRIDTPLQVGHPLEYYEDRYTKAVALEWDLRIVNPQLQEENGVRESIKAFASALAVKLGLMAEKIYLKNLEQIEAAQLYIGRPMLYYGAELNGLFSAQVVPNDEKVSSKMGKKIFAYADFVRESKITKPVTLLQVETFGEEFVRKEREVLKYKPRLWNEIYSISTIGHEFGHILWIDEDSEVLMNRKGEFKNIEEFKATCGGLMGFFEKGKKELEEHILDELVSRAVGLMAYREVPEVYPYYCEGLIHLSLLKESGVLKIEERRVEIDYSRYALMRDIYRAEYERLALHYVKMSDASDYLYRFVSKSGKEYLPRDAQLEDFVERYYERYLQIGRSIAPDWE